MPDYKEMYLTMCRASEEALNTIIAAQRKCEEIYSPPKTLRKNRQKQRPGNNSPASVY